MSTPRYLSGLDGLRGIAAFVVLMLHTSIYFELSSISHLFKNHAYLAVDCFYMISGFIIAHSFDRKMDQGLSLTRFYVSRMVRLYPMLIVGAALGAFELGYLWILHREIPLSSMATAALSGFLLVPTYALLRYKPYVFPLNSSFWSLSFEFVLYAFYAISYRPLKRPAAFAVALGVSAAALICVSTTAGGLDVGYRADDYLLGFGRSFLPFIIGIAIRRSPLYRPNSLHFGSFTALLAIPLFCNPLAKSGLHDAIAVLLLLPLMIVCLANASLLGPLDRFSHAIGELSYPLYAIHYPIVVALSNTCKPLHLSASSNAAAACTCLICTIAAAMVLSRYYDRPVRAELGRLVSAASPSYSRIGA